MTDRANTPLHIGEMIFKRLVWDNLVEAGVLAIFAAVPVLGFWPFAPIIRYALSLFTDKIFFALKLVIDVQAIAFVNSEHKKAFDAESIKLKVLALDHGIDSPEFKEERENAKVKLSAFIQFGR